MKDDKNDSEKITPPVNSSLIDLEVSDTPSTGSTVKKTTYRGGLIGRANSPLVLSMKKRIVLEPNAEDPKIDYRIDKHIFDWFEMTAEKTWMPVEIKKGKFAVAFQDLTPDFPLDEALNLEKKDEVMRAFGFTDDVLPAPGVGVLGIGLRYGLRYKDSEGHDRKDKGYPCFSLLKNVAKSSKTIDEVLDDLALGKYGETGLQELLKVGGFGVDLDVEKFKKQIGYGQDKTDFNKQMFVASYLPFLITRMYMKLSPSMENIKKDVLKCLNCDAFAIDDYLIGRYMKIPKSRETEEDEYRAHGFLIVHKDSEGATKIQYVDASKNGARIVHHDASYDSVIANIKREKELDKFDKPKLTRNTFEGDVEKFVSEEDGNVLVRVGRNPANAEYNTPICRDVLIDMDSEEEQIVDIILADNGHQENRITITKPAKKSA